jgi:prepilin-type N-terminal cleavage/methylation domain-containing protein
MAYKKGFTLIEVLVTTAVLAFGIVSIFQALFIIMTAFNYASHYLRIVSAVDEKVWQARDAVMRMGPGAVLEPQGTFDTQDKKYEWALSAKLVDPAGNLSRIDMAARWNEGSRQYVLERSAYVIYEAPDEKK